MYYKTSEIPDDDFYVTLNYSRQGEFCIRKEYIHL